MPNKRGFYGSTACAVMYNLSFFTRGKSFLMQGPKGNSAGNFEHSVANIRGTFRFLLRPFL